MSDPDFERLRRTPAPTPSAEAREAALAAAMAAFDAQAAEKAATARKGTRPSGRHTSASPSWAWRTIMQNRMAIGGAAACLVAAPIAALLFAQQQGGLPKLGTEADRLARQAPPSPPSVQEGAKAKTESTDASPEREAARRSDPRFGAPAEPVPPPPPAAPRQAQAQRPADALAAAPMARRQEGFVSRSLIAPSPQRDGVVQETPRDRFVDKPQNEVKVAAQEPVSTFSIDADTASYSWVRRALLAGRQPTPDEVRVEELINYFPYDYPRPGSADAPFRPSIAVVPTPWNADTRLVRIGIKGFEPQPAARPKANLVFLIDVSGSMQAADKLPLVKTSLKLLLDRLAPDDRVAIVTYAGGAGIALEPTQASDREDITAAIDRLTAGGSTAGAAGIEEAYRLARKHFDAKGVNRVLLATDGDFNVGVSDDGGLTRLVERERRSGVYLSVLGFGQGNYNDALMQRLAQNGNGKAAYIDQLEEAQKVLVEEAGSTLFPIAKDVKIQVEFNPSQVSEYRLIGYETRALSRTDFNDDRVDAGEVGSGASVTALYEIVPAGGRGRLADDLRYAPPAAPAPAGAGAGELGFLKLRYKLPNEDASRLIEQPIVSKGQPESLAAAPDDVRFAAAVAAFGQKLKGARQLEGMEWAAIADLAEGARGADRWGYRAGFVRLVRLADALARR
ncbi:vWA domain-containing protein [Hansschlegelia sp. KR7-227]|uniref:vWA domain-containing protein n=1 Tax=Hansschlegelia sp. KR7-227 TaxID=3400914 RepID=UPI003C100110